MSALLQLDGIEAAAHLPPRPIHLALGMFDGLHLGHRAVLDAAVQSARRSGGLAAMLTFWPHPSVLFRPDQPTRLIQPTSLKSLVAAELGVEVMITQPFTTELAALAAEEFLPWLRRGLARLAGIYIGENFRFGRARLGDVALLTAAGRREGLTVFSAPRVSLDGEPISSTRIRGLLEAGEIAAANTLLGYTYFSPGTVTAGKQLGRTLGFPTLNIAWTPELRPRFGVYAVRVIGKKNASPENGVANYGLRPTVESASEPRLETHILGPTAYDAGDEIRVEWLKFLRPEKKFAGLAELRQQIAADRDAAAAFFGGSV